MESDEQKKVIAWAVTMEYHIPALKTLYHIPNGGSRNKIEAAHLKQQGVKSGVPDLCLPVARGTYHGLYIEMKYGKNKVTKNQIEWLRMLKGQGYATAVCYTAQEAIRKIERYLNLAEEKRKEIK